jgi:hypothetical protein
MATERGQVMVAIRYGAALLGLLWALSGVSLAAPQDTSMRFRLIPWGDKASCGDRCPLAIVAEGEIRFDTPARFRAFVASQNGNRRLHAVVLLSSPGGSVEASMMLGQMFRQTKVLAIVGTPLGGGRIGGARCYSACAYALMGGLRRIVPPTSSVGIHRMHLDERGAASRRGGGAERVYGTPQWVERLTAYAVEMGISRDLIATAETIAPEHIKVLSAQEMKRWNLADSSYR